VRGCANGVCPHAPDAPIYHETAAAGASDERRPRREVGKASSAEIGTAEKLIASRSRPFNLRYLIHIGADLMRKIQETSQDAK
jgi:hypothetical protein